MDINNESKMDPFSDIGIKKKDFKSTTVEKMGKFSRSFFDSIQVIVVALAVVVLVYIFVASFNIVDGESMLPNFEPRDLIVSEKITTNWGTLQRGDVIVFQASVGRDFIKRIIGLPGDRVMVKNGKMNVNDIPLNEPYLSLENQDIAPGTEAPEGI